MVHYDNNPDLLKGYECGKAFFVEAYSFMGKLFFYCKIPASDLKFKKQNERIIDKVYISIEVIDKLTGEVIKKSFQEEFFLKNKRYVNNINFYKRYILEDVNYGDYEISISFIDEAGNYLLAKKQFELSNKRLSAEILIAPPVLMSYVAVDYIAKQCYFTEFDNKTFVPYIYNRIAYDEDLFAFQYYITNRSGKEKRVRIKYVLENEKREIVSKRDTLLTLSPEFGKVYDIIYIDKLKDLRNGKYSFNIYLNGSLKAKKEFLVEGMILPFISSFELALKSLKYIASNKEYRAIIKEKI